jgi:membrane glycosyltransferase
VKPKAKKTKVKVVPASPPKPKPAKPIRQKRRPRKLTDDQKTNIAVMIWCLLMLACLVTGVTGFWKLFAGTISYGGACWMIFPSIIIGGLLWIFNEAI